MKGLLGTRTQSGSPTSISHPRLVDPIRRERVADRDPGETMEVLVRRPELAHTVLAQERRDVSIVGDVARRPSRRNHVAQMSTMARTLAEQRDRGSVEEPVDFLEGPRQRCRGFENP